MVRPVIFLWFAMLRLPGLLVALTLGFLMPLSALAECRGSNLFDRLAPDKLAAIQAATDATPFATGNFWRATRGEEVITIAGTYHLEDPRHAENLAALTPDITAATTVLVEAGPAEMKALQTAIAKDPSTIAITTGPTLYEQLPPEVWTKLSDALAQRGVPAFMGAKFKPWYIIAILSVPPCMMKDMVGEPKGLDGLVIDTAEAAGVPVRALEPFDTIFHIFDQMDMSETIAMIEATLALEDQVEDQAFTLAESYFAGDSRKMWELLRHVSYDMPGVTRTEVDAEFRNMDEILMLERNRSWIPVLTAAAKEGPVFAAFGALHLSGEEGVLNLLQAEGFTLEELHP